MSKWYVKYESKPEGSSMFFCVWFLSYDEHTFDKILRWMKAFMIHREFSGDMKPVNYEIILNVKLCFMGI